MDKGSIKAYACKLMRMYMLSYELQLHVMHLEPSGMQVAAHGMHVITDY